MVGRKKTPRVPSEQRGETEALAGLSREESISKLRGMNPWISKAGCDDQGTVAEDAEAATAEGRTPGSGVRGAELSSPPRPSSSVPGCAAGRGGAPGPSASVSYPSPPVHSPQQWFAREERKAIDVFLQVGRRALFSQERDGELGGWVGMEGIGENTCCSMRRSNRVDLGARVPVSVPVTGR